MQEKTTAVSDVIVIESNLRFLIFFWLTPERWKATPPVMNISYLLALLLCLVGLSSALFST